MPPAPGRCIKSAYRTTTPWSSSSAVRAPISTRPSSTRSSASRSFQERIGRSDRRRTGGVHVAAGPGHINVIRVRAAKRDDKRRSVYLVGHAGSCGTIKDFSYRQTFSGNGPLVVSESVRIVAVLVHLHFS